MKILLFCIAHVFLISISATAQSSVSNLGNLGFSEIARTYNSSKGIVCYIVRGDQAAISCVKRSGINAPAFSKIGTIGFGEVKSISDTTFGIDCVVTRGDGAAISCM